MKIFPKLLTWFLILALIPLIVFSIVLYDIAYKVEIREKKADLAEIAEEQVFKSSKFFSALEKEALLIAYSKNFTKVLSGKSEQERPFFKYFSELLSLNDLYIIGKEGMVIFSLNNSKIVSKDINSGIYKESQLAKAFARTIILLEPSITHSTFLDFENKGVILFTLPVFKEGVLTSVLALEIPEERIYQIFEDYAGLKKTGEIVLGEQKNEKIIFSNFMQRKLKQIEPYEIEFGSNLEFPLQQAVKGIRGGGVSTDYRGEKVLAVWDYLPNLQLGMVVKMDLKEVLFPLSHLRLSAILFIGTIMIIVILIAIYLTKSFSNPIKQLQKGIEVVGGGDLKYRVGTRAKDEIGLLSRGFDQAIEKLNLSLTSNDNLNREITRRKIAEEMKANFFAVASHELRGPIGPINESLKIILEKEVGPLNQEQIKLLKIAQNNSQRLLTIVNDILDYRQLEVGRVKYVFVKADLNKLLYDACELVRIAAEKKGLNVQLTLSDQPVYVMCDQSRITQVVTNLLNNAIKFSDEGQIEVKCSQVDQFARVEVCDMGPGIAKEDIPKLFISFSQLKQQQLGGTGLGLAICKMIISDHRGEIWVESQLDHGSSFIFTLPLS